MLARIFLYLREMYPPLQRLIFAVVYFYAPYFCLQIIDGQTRLEWSFRSLTGALTLYFFLMFLRVSDEFKDAELDRKLFPERAYPSGRVLEKDLIMLHRFCLLALLALNLWTFTGLKGFLVLFAFGLLMLKFFFIKERIQKSLLLALVTHNPSVFMIHIFINAIYADERGLALLRPNFFWISLLFFVPGLAWELARKVRAPRDENEYETYSKIFGYKLAALLPVALNAVHFGVLIYLRDRLGLDLYFISLMGGLFLLSALKSVRFIAEPSVKTSNLKPVAELYLIGSSIIFVAEILLHHVDSFLK